MTLKETDRIRETTIITDPGIDDVIALALLKKMEPEIPVTVVPTFGNAPLETTSKNAEDFILSSAPHWNLAEGSGVPQNGVLECPYPYYFHGPDGVWGIHPALPKHQSVHEGVTQKGYVYSIGPMTAVARMMKEGQIQEMTVMGGAFGIGGNETDYAETNIRFDPDAAEEVFRIARPNTIRIVPLDVTRQVAWDRKTVESIPARDATSQWIKQMLLAWFDHGSHDREVSFNLHDPLAVYLSYHPEHATWVTSGVSVTLDGVERGRTLYDINNPVVQIATNVDNGTMIAQDIYTILFSKAESLYPHHF
jgi:purine nucleosidase